MVLSTVITPSLESKWDGDEDGNCKLCLVEPGTIQHNILSGCNEALKQKRYTWRNDKVLRHIYNQVLYHVGHRVNNSRRSPLTSEP